MKWLHNYKFSLLDQQWHFDADLDQMSQEPLILRFVWLPFCFAVSFILVLDHQCLVVYSLLKELHLMGCQNQACDLCSEKGWVGSCKAKTAMRGQGSSSKCPITLTALLGSLKFHKADSLQVILFVWSFCRTFPFNGNPDFLLLVPFSLICCSDQLLHQIQKSWKES